MSEEHGKDSLYFDAKSNKYLLCGEVLPQSWRSAGFAPIKKKLQETNAMLFACKNGGTSREFLKNYHKKMHSPVNRRGKQLTLAEGTKILINHRKCTKLKAAVFLSLLTEKQKERKLNELHSFLDSVVDILRALVNLRSRDLRTKTPLSTAELNQLRQRTGGHVADTLQKHPPWHIDTMEPDQSNKNPSHNGRRPTVTDLSNNLLERMVSSWNLVKARQSLESRNLIRNIESMEPLRKSIQLAIIGRPLTTMENYRLNVNEALPKSPIITLDEKEIDKVAWCDNLDDLCQIYANPHELFPQLKTLRKFSLLDFTKVISVKAKFCLYVLSLPANEILTVPTQRALIFVSTVILPFSKAIMRQWMDYRNLPLYDLEPLV